VIGVVWNICHLSSVQPAGQQHLALIIKNNHAQRSAQQHQRLILGGIRMPVRRHIRIRAHGIEKPVAGIIVARVQIEVLAPPRGGGSFGSQPVKEVGSKHTDIGHVHGPSS